MSIKDLTLGGGGGGSYFLVSDRGVSSFWSRGVEHGRVGVMAGGRFRFCGSWSGSGCGEFLYQSLLTGDARRGRLMKMRERDNKIPLAVTNHQNINH